MSRIFILIMLVFCAVSSAYGQVHSFPDEIFSSSEQIHTTSEQIHFSAGHILDTAYHVVIASPVHIPQQPINVIPQQAIDATPMQPIEVIPEQRIEQPIEEISQQAIDASPEQTIDADSVYIHFRVGKYDLMPRHYRNASALRKITDSLQNRIETKWVVYELSGIKITGSASPEGSYALNQRLSQNRAREIQKWLRSHSKLPAHLMKQEFLGKNWPMLLELAQADNNIPYRDETLELLETASDSNDIILPLQNLRKGVPYRYLLKNIFPHLRFTKIYVEYDRYPKYAPIPHISKAIEVSVATDCRPSVKPVPQQQPQPEPEPQPQQPQPERKFWFAAKTNMLYDALITPNVGVEFNIDKQRRYSVAANWMYAWWKSDPDSWYHRTYGGDIELRRYFGKQTQERPFTGWHAGVYGQMLTYDFEWGGRGYLGDKWSWAAGISGGWSKAIGKRLNLDFTLGVGYLWGEYQEYLPIDDCYVWQATKNRRWIGPTKAEVSLVWILGRW